MIQAGPGPLRTPDDGTCGICLEDIAPAEATVVHNACRNTWHKHCLDPWVESVRRRSGDGRGTCPVCHTPIITAVVSGDISPAEDEDNDFEDDEMVFEDYEGDFQDAGIYFGGDEEYFEDDEMGHERDPDRVTIIEEAQRISWAAGIFRTRSGLAGPIGLSSRNACGYGLIYTHTMDIARWTSNSRLAESVDTDDLQQWARYCSPGYPQDFLVPFDDRDLPNNSDIGDLVLSETSQGIFKIAGSLAEVKDRWNVPRLSLQGVTEAGNFFSLGRRDRHRSFDSASEGHRQRFLRLCLPRSHRYFLILALSQTPLLYAVPLPQPILDP